ncbi:MAG: glutamine synthetase beta-grasp domain-containing protein, partial [Alphaproteobacteria bacterium]|nr:glutamine synthetase beta-grasp domain-containing protein [Alphaproteobacteria bacterium]
MTLNCKTPEDVLKAIADDDIKHVDLRFTDPRGKLHHLTQWHTTIDEDCFEDGFMFDGSS